MRKQYITPVQGIESLADSLYKMSEQEQLAAEETRMAEANLDAARKKEQSAAAKPVDTRQDADIEGMDMDGSDAPTDQAGTVLPAEAPLPPFRRSWFTDNFGVTGSELTDILVKANDLTTLDAIQPLLRMEKEAILAHFVGVSSALVDELPMTDKDYDSLNKNAERLDLPFRRFVKCWTSSDEGGKGEAERLWRMTIDKSERLSNRERNILHKCKTILDRRGALNAQTLKSYGVQASPAEISSLIKSHGFLFDIISVGQFSKSVGRGLFYDVRRQEILLKDADRFIAGLIENNSDFKMDSRFYPRLEMRFVAPTASWYASALKKEMGVENIDAKGSRLIIEGEQAVLKALEVSVPHLNGHSPEAVRMLKALQGDENALIVLAYDSSKPEDQGRLLRKHNISTDDLDSMREEVVAVGS